ncbi:hypothetical protein BJ170DRAFT_638893 [Xylariales sp. AK1849]|nr:hypothetical protein BJ170DRAFT_638893 [Xylariales sp. AK1849]
MSLVTSASIHGNGLFFGILALSMHGLIASYSRTDPKNGSDITATKYTPLFETVRLNSIGQLSLSVAMSRDDDRSFTSFGGVPPNVKTVEVITRPFQ